ncbi:MAG: 50S ribosomal protein L1 [Patescibacteria group bacterium]|nr:50S ribosomal protein L1 [Patescibacteria group bacterium]
MIEKDKLYSKEEAIELIKKTTVTKFDSSVEVHIRLGIDIKKADQQVRGSVVLPNGLGKEKVVLAIVGPTKEKEAKDAKADFIGGTSMIDKINKGWLEFDAIVATPDMMGELGKAAKILGPKGLMPNPKVGTVTQDIAKTIQGLKTGMVEYKTDSFGIVHQTIGKVSFEPKKLLENYDAFLDAIKKAKPKGSKGVYLKGVYLTTTMGPSVKVEL